MSMRGTAVAAAVGGLFALGIASPGLADDAAGKEKCFGIVLAAKIDCATPAHACAAQSTKSADSREWIYVPNGTCERIVGGSLTAGKKK